ncbi:hypothetical protein RCH10_003779 [Variovorax sp. GrIS 2.14]|uniref:hypothetical protein n=1 Tax=Variovorax sp. GrIS 2.14 TaxID=3071709 RepID=UPI0038F66FB9
MTEDPQHSALKLTQFRKENGEHETEAEVIGRSAADSAVCSGVLIKSFGGYIPGDADVSASVDEVRRITKAVKGGDLSDLEAMLVSQAMALQSMATSLAMRAQRQGAQRNFESMLNLSFKAQSQSRATVQALVELKYPRQVVFAKNVANVNNGQQQINHNGAPATNDESAQIKQLGVSDGEWLDTGATCTTGRTDTHLAPVGQINGTTKPRRKSCRVS